jgi:hypothetical protein
MSKKAAVVIKAYNSAKEREEGGKPLATKTVHSVEEFDAAVEEFSFPAKYLAFEGTIDVKLKTRDSARFILQNQ